MLINIKTVLLSINFYLLINKVIFLTGFQKILDKHLIRIYLDFDHSEFSIMLCVFNIKMHFFLIRGKFSWVNYKFKHLFSSFTKNTFQKVYYML